MSCEKIITDIIEKNGGISVYDYMNICLQHPIYGYYRTGNPIGRGGDFMTSPEISQCFGEMIGLFLRSHHAKFFDKNNYAICEMGAGRGTLLSDIVRVLPNDMIPKNIYILESNDILKEQQRQNIKNVIHIASLNDLPKMPIFFVANEFFDALPIDIYRIMGDICQKMMIRLAQKVARLGENKVFRVPKRSVQVVHEYRNAEKSKFADHLVDFLDNSIVKNQHHDYNMTWSQDITNPLMGNYDYPKSGIIEHCPDGINIMNIISNHIQTHKGMGLFCDYGYVNYTDKISFRGFYQHQVTDGLSHLGQSDLTADVDFSVLSQIAQKNNLSADILPQADFLNKMYIDVRLNQILKNISDEKTRYNMMTGVNILINPDDMGHRFKFLCVTPQKDMDIYPFD